MMISSNIDVPTLFYDPWVSFERGSRAAKANELGVTVKLQVVLP